MTVGTTVQLTRRIPVIYTSQVEYKTPEEFGSGTVTEILEDIGRVRVKFSSGEWLLYPEDIKAA